MKPTKEELEALESRIYSIADKLRSAFNELSDIYQDKALMKVAKKVDKSADGEINLANWTVEAILKRLWRLCADVKMEQSK